MFIGRTDAESETLILWPCDEKNWLNGKDPDAGKNWRREEKGTTEDETVGWHPQLNRHDCEQAPGVGDGQGGLACSGSWGCKESDLTERLNWTEAIAIGFKNAYSHSAWNAGDLVLIPGLGRSPGEGNGYSLHDFAWRIPLTEEPRGAIQGITKSWTSLSNQPTHTQSLSTFSPSSLI